MLLFLRKLCRENGKTESILMQGKNTTSEGEINRETDIPRVLRMIKLLGNRTLFSTFLRWHQKLRSWLT